MGPGLLPVIQRGTLSESLTISSFVHSFNYFLFSYNYLSVYCTRHCAKSWGSNSEQDKLGRCLMKPTSPFTSGEGEPELLEGKTDTKQRND